MTQEDKKLLLKDLCNRLPYLENWVRYDGKDYVITGYGHGRVSLLSSMFSSGVGPCPLVEEVKPYLRPMSSMTEEEESEWRLTFDTVYDLVPGGDPDNEDDYDDNWHNEPSAESFDWLNEHHFDYRGLIEKGLAIKVTPENNPYK